MEYNDKEYSPENIAKALFTQPPETAKRYQIITGVESNDPSFIFEILLTIFLEGLDILTGGIDRTDLDNLTLDYINNLKPWFASICFELKVDVFDDTDKLLIDNYYCRIILNNKKADYMLFQLKRIEKNYHFLLSANFDKERKYELNDIFAIFKHRDQIYRIRFLYFI